MIVSKDLGPILQGEHRLHDALSASGFTHSDLEELVNCELDVSHLLSYIDAVLSEQMN